MLAQLRHPAARAAICHADAESGLRRTDPTGTLKFRRKGMSELDRRWRAVFMATREFVVTADAFGLLKNSTLALSMQIFGSKSGLGMDANRLKNFQTFFDQTLQRFMLEGSEAIYLKPLIVDCYWHAIHRALRLLENPQQVANRLLSSDKVATLHRIAIIELQGIMEAVSQQVIRQVAHAVLVKTKPQVLMRDIHKTILSTGAQRSRALVQMIAVRAFSEGTLDAFEQAKLTHVSILPEFIRVRPRDGDPQGFKDARRRGPGAFAFRRAPSTRTVQRIRAVQQELEEELPRVNVITAGDTKVCPICLDIEEEGPYTIDEARGLIPAHISCRCAFLPA